MQINFRLKWIFTITLSLQTKGCHFFYFFGNSTWASVGSLIGTLRVKYFSSHILPLTFFTNQVDERKFLPFFPIYRRFPQTWATFTYGGPPFSPATWPARFCSLVYCPQAGGPPSVEIGWGTETIIFEDDEGHKMTSFFTFKFFGAICSSGNFFNPCSLVKNSRNSPRKIGATK